MTVSTSDPKSVSLADPDLAALVDELTDRLQGGEAVDLEAYIARHPEHADPLRQLVPALEMIGELKRSAARRAASPTSPGPDAGLEAGVLGDFRIVREVGRGGMGVVYEAEQISLARRVALKILPLAAAMDAKQLQRFQLEAQAAACLHHTNIVPVHAVGCERGVPFYAMQYIEGRSLVELIRELRRLEGLDVVDQPADGPAEISTSTLAARLLSGRLADGSDRPRKDDATALVGERRDQPEPATPAPVTEPATPTARPSAGPSGGSSTRSRDYVRTVAQLGVQIAEALDHAHTRGILHRDIKPGNLLLDKEGQLWVTDFGLAQVQGNPCVTLTGDVLGTLRYMSPEQALAKRVLIDGRTDIYSLGVTLYELVTLRPVVDGQDRQEILRMIAEAEPVPPRQLNASLSRDLETVLLKAMAKEPSARYATAKDLADELRRFLDHKPIAARRPSVLDRAAKWARRHRGAVATGMVGLLTAAVITAAATGWIVRDRAARWAMTEREVNLALDEAAVFEAQAKWPQALEAAKRAEGIVAAGASAELRSRVQELRTDVEMVLRLEEIWMPRVGGGSYFDSRSAVAYAAAFREYGIEVEGLETSVAAARIRARKIRLELALALDLWALVLKGQNRALDATAESRLLAVARAADPDEWRNQTRTAIERRDYQAVQELAASPQAARQPAPTLIVLRAQPVRDRQFALSLLRRAQRVRPDNFDINFQLAWDLAYDPRSQQELDEAIRFFTVALALRPWNADTAFWLAQALRRRGRVDEQIAYNRMAIAMNPRYLPPYFALSSALEAQGQRNEAVAVLRQAADTSSDDPQDLNNLAWLLATSQFPELRDGSRAVELAQRAVELAPELGGAWNTLGAAQYRAGSWQGAIAALERSMALRRGGDSSDWFFLAMAHWRLGERDKARVWYERAVQWMEKNAPGHKELSRFRAEAAELLQRKEKAQEKIKNGPH
jgi:serine/threonine protein kinase/Flp pilus assembly protein TadD